MAEPYAVTQLRTAFSDTFLMYYKAHVFHWNVMGADFPQYHSLFERIYEDVYGAVDAFAELIRTLDVLVPGSLELLIAGATVRESADIASPASGATNSDRMLVELMATNDTVLASLNDAFRAATAANRQGIANFLADRIGQHEKHGWMLRSVTRCLLVGDCCGE